MISFDPHWTVKMWALVKKGKGGQELAQVFKSLHTRVELGESMTTSQSQVICCCLRMTIKLIFQDFIQTNQNQDSILLHFDQSQSLLQSYFNCKRLRFQVSSMSAATNLHLPPTTCNLARPTQPSYSVKNSSVLPRRWRISFFLLRLVWITSKRTNMTSYLRKVKMPGETKERFGDNREETKKKGISRWKILRPEGPTLFLLIKHGTNQKAQMKTASPKIRCIDESQGKGNEERKGDEPSSRPHFYQPSRQLGNNLHLVNWTSGGSWPADHIQCFSDHLISWSVFHSQSVSWTQLWSLHQAILSMRWELV